MNTRFSQSILSALCCLFFVVEACADEPDSWLDKLVNAGVEIRKSYAGSAKDAGAPASVSYENPDTGPDFYGIDMGIKAGAFLEEQLSSGNWGGRLAPTIEVHRSTKQFDEVRKLGGGLTLELERGYSTSNDPFARMLFADVKIEFNRDSVQDQTTQTGVLRVGWYDVVSRYGPGKDIVFGETAPLSVRWLPTAAVENYRKLPIKGKVGGQSVVLADAVDSTLASARLNVLIKPFRNALDAKLGLTTTYTVRQSVGGDDFFGKTTRLLEVSVDYFLDPQNRFSFGFSYQKGRDPNRNFLDEEFSSVGLKLLLSK